MEYKRSSPWAKFIWRVKLSARGIAKAGALRLRRMGPRLGTYVVYLVVVASLAAGFAVTVGRGLVERAASVVTITGAGRDVGPALTSTNSDVRSPAKGGAGSAVGDKDANPRSAWDAAVKAVGREADLAAAQENVPRVKPSGQTDGATEDKDSSAVSPATMIRPASGKVIEEFGWYKHPVYDDWRFHGGVDIGCPQGTPVYAALPGTVEQVYDDPELGRTVVLSHPGNLKTVYGHCSAVSVSPGQKVDQGVVIARAGASGMASSPRLYFQVVDAGEPQDPQKYLGSVER